MKSHTKRGSITKCLKTIWWRSTSLKLLRKRYSLIWKIKIGLFILLWNVPWWRSKMLPLLSWAMSFNWSWRIKMKNKKFKIVSAENYRKWVIKKLRNNLEEKMHQKCIFRSIHINSSYFSASSMMMVMLMDNSKLKPKMNLTRSMRF